MVDENKGIALTYPSELRDVVLTAFSPDQYGDTYSLSTRHTVSQAKALLQKRGLEDQVTVKPACSL